MSDHDETPEVVEDRPSPVLDDPAPADPPEDLDEDQADEAPRPHATARGFGVVGKFSTTDRSGDL